MDWSKEQVRTMMLEVVSEVLSGSQTFVHEKLTSERPSGALAPVVVRLMYFKPGGKYYSDGAFTTLRVHFHEVVEDVRFMQRSGKLPGLAAGSRDFVIVLPVMEPWGVPHLFPVMAEGECDAG